MVIMIATVLGYTTDPGFTIILSASPAAYQLNSRSGQQYQPGLCEREVELQT